MPYFFLITLSTCLHIFASIACLFNLLVSISIASLCLSKGPNLLFVSWLFLILRAFLTSLNLILLSFFFNSLYLLKAAVFKLHLKKNFISESGSIFVETSLPSIQQFLNLFENFVWKFFKIFLILFIFAIFDVFFDISGVCRFILFISL